MLTVSQEKLTCKICRSDRLVKVGQVKGVQRWECRSCGRRFMENTARFGMKTPSSQVHLALCMYYQGVSIPSICRRLQSNYNNYPSFSSVYKWIDKYSRSYSKDAEKHRPAVGKTWFFDETSLEFLGTRVCVWDIVDIETHFLLASAATANRNTAALREFLEKAFKKAGKLPETVLSERLTEFDRAFVLPRNSFEINKTVSVETARLHSTFESRTRFINDLKSMGSVNDFLNGWLNYYNYFDHPDYLGGKTPAQLAKIEY